MDLTLNVLKEMERELVNVCQNTSAIHTLDVDQNASQTPNVLEIRPVSGKNVLTHALACVVQTQSVQL